MSEGTFATTVQKTNELLREIEERLGWPSERRDQSYAALRAVLHVLRDRLTVEEAADFGAQLTPLLRGIFYEGWKPSRVPIKMDRAKFINAIREQFRYSLEGSIENLIQTVFGVISQHVEPGEIDDVVAMLPQDIQTLLKPA